MAFTQDEASRIKSDVESLKASATNVFSAIGEGAAAQRENTKTLKENTILLNELLVAFSKREVRDEYREKEMLSIHEEVKDIKDTVNLNRKEYMAPLERLKRSQGRVDRFWEGATSNWGKMTAFALIISVAYALNIDLSKLLGK